MVTLVNRAKVNTATTGTGTITLGTAVDGYQTFAAAGVTNGNVVRYVIEDGTGWEIGTGTYAATGSTLTRTVSESSNGGAAISLGGDATVFVGLLASDIVQVSDVGVTVQAYDADIVSDAAYVHTDNNYTTAEKSKLAGIEAGATADQTAAEILTAVKTVDGVASGLDADLLDGLHAASFLQGNQTITLSGDATGSGTTSIVVTVADDSHNHIISNVDGLQTALDGKAPTSHTHTAAQITDFDAEVSNNTSVAANTAKVSNATHTGEVTGSTALTIASNVVDADNLKVTGNGTTSQYLRSDGDGSFTWATPPDTVTNQTITLSGDATGSGTTSIVVTVADDSHNHVWGNIDGASVGALAGPRFTTASGWIEFGPANASWAHINTDRPNFYFYKGANFQGNITLTGTVDGRDVAADGTKLDGIASGANNYSFPYTVSQASTGSTVVQRDGSGDINARLFRSEYDSTNAGCQYFMTQVDTASNNYLRPSTLAQVRSAVGSGYAAGSVGSYIVGERTTNRAAAFGSTYSGLSATSCYGNYRTAVGGTWRCMGGAGASGPDYTTLWLRIS